MSSGYTNLNPTITIESLPVFSASFAAAKVSPVSAIIITGLPDGVFSLDLSVVCSVGGETVFSFERDFGKTSCRLFDYEHTGRLFVRLGYGDFSVDTELLDLVLKNAEAETVVTVCVDGTAYTAKNTVILAKADEWQGIALRPETLASFVLPFMSQTEELTENLAKATEWTSFAEMCETVGELIKRIRSKNIICTKRDGYSPEKKQTITTIDRLCEKSAVLASPAELAVLFCSVAANLGMKPIISFVKNNIGVVSVFCGIASHECYDFVITESISRLRRALDDDELLLFDPAILSSAQTIDAERAGQLASEIIHKNGTDMLLTLNVASCFDMGVTPMHGSAVAVDDKTQADPKDVLGEVYSGIIAGKTFKMLSGDYASHDVLPLIGFDFDNYATAVSDGILVKPMEVSENLAEYAGISDGFASFALKDTKSKAYNKAELAEVTEKYRGFVRRIKSKGCAVVGMYEKQFHERISRMCFGLTPGYANYIICGFVRLTDSQTAEVTYFPIAFADASLTCDFDYLLKLSGRRVILNTVLASYLARNAVDAGTADSIDKAFALFENLAEKAIGSGEFSEVKIIREFALIKADFSELALWNDIRSNTKNMLSGGLSELLAEKSHNSEEADKAEKFVFPRFSENRINEILKNDSNAVISGSGSAEMLDIAVNKAVMNVDLGKSVLVSSRNESFCNAFANELAVEGFGDAVLRLDQKTDSATVASVMRKRLDEAKALVFNPSGDIATEFDKVSDRIKSYVALFSKTDPVLGITLYDAVLSFYRSYDTPNGAKIDIIPVAENAFKNMTQHKFNVLFENAEKLVSSAENAQKAVGLSVGTPVSKNPLYPINAPCELDEAKLGELFDIISKINSVIADYRETFFAVSEQIGILPSDVKNLKGLYSVNELYKTVISARELDIPESLSERDVADFADGAVRLGKELDRAENIEYRLKFFSREIFEDVDSLLSGYSKNDGSQGGFIKKFLVRKNNKDVLLQYVPNENRAEFSRHDVEEIFSLLDEYRSLKTSTAEADEKYSGENSVKLAELIKTIEKLLCGIYGENGSYSSKIIKIFDFIKTVSSDVALSKKLTYARAKLAGVYSDNECLLGELSEKINADFSLISFDGGILAYDGLTKYLKELEKNLPAVSVWSKWLEAKKNASDTLPEFAKYIENVGVKENTDRVFASSLILPSIGYLTEKYDCQKFKKSFDNAKQNYGELYRKAREISSSNAYSAYMQRMKHFAQTENLPSLEADAELSLREFVGKYKNALLVIFPIVFANPEDVGMLFGCERTADTLICDGGVAEGVCMLSAVACVDNVLLLKLDGRSSLAERLIKAGAEKEKMSYRLYPACRQLTELCDNARFYTASESLPKASVVTLNGVMRRTGDMANPAEAELCVTKACDVVTKTDMSVGVFALTGGQFAYISHLFCVTAQNDKSLKKALSDGRITVVEPGKTCFDKFDCSIVSIGAGQDVDGNIGWSFGVGTPNDAFAVLKNTAQATKDRVMLVSSLTSKELLRLKNSGYEAEMLYHTLLSAQNKYIPMTTQMLDDENAELRYMMLCETDTAPACGRFSLVAEAIDADGNIYTYDCGSQTDVFDRLYAVSLLNDDGKCRLISPVDRVTAMLSDSERQ